MTNNETLTAVLSQLVNNNKSDSERLIRQEANYEHLTNTISAMANTTTEALSRLTDKTGELATTVQKIALSEEHIEKRVLKEIDNLKDEFLQARGDSFARNEKMELMMLDNNKRILNLEKVNSTRDGESANDDKSRDFWNANGLKLVFLAILAVPLIAELYNIIKGS